MSKSLGDRAAEMTVDADRLATLTQAIHWLETWGTADNWSNPTTSPVIDLRASAATRELGYLHAITFVERKLLDHLIQARYAALTEAKEEAQGILQKWSAVL